MRVQLSEEVTAVALRSGLAPRTAAAAPKTSFADALVKTSSNKTEKTEKPAEGPKGETTRKVPGHDYVEIMSGPRNGMFINTSHNGRHGEVFARVRKDDRDLHIYGSGKDRRVVTVMHEDKGPEKTRKVENHDYVEITSGPRNGQFINTSGNENDGRAFVLVEKKDHNLHIYGTGKDRRVIIDYNGPAPARRHGDDEKPAGKQTGGATAPDTSS